MQNLESTTIDALQAFLRVQLTAVQQHFIHVLILQARGNHAFAERITAIDNTDLSVAMQLVELLVAQNISPLDCDSLTDPVSSMPRTGFTDEAILVSETALETELADALKNALAIAAENEGDGAGDLLVRALRPRADYEVWLRREAGSQARSGSPAADAPAVDGLGEDAGLALNGMFANLMTVIVQDLIHAFVHRRAGKGARADIAWEISGAAMMMATQITRLLAKHRQAPAPQMASVASSTVCALRIDLTTDDALRRDRVLARHCMENAGNCIGTLNGTEFEPVARQCRDYFASVVVWRDGDSLPDMPNPCRDFERTLDLYVRPVAQPHSA